MSDPNRGPKDWKSARLANAGLRGGTRDDRVRKRYFDLKREDPEYFGKALKTLLKGKPVVPNAKDQMVGGNEGTGTLEERAWLRYYNRYSGIPADPILLTMIEGLIQAEDEKAAKEKPDADPSP